MGGFIKGNVVTIPFPFSDLTAQKTRPALVISKLGGDDIILCQITSKIHNKDTYWIELSTEDFVSGSLNKDSFIRPNKLFTADSKIINKNIGSITTAKLNAVIEKLTQIIRN